MGLRAAICVGPLQLLEQCIFQHSLDAASRFLTMSTLEERLHEQIRTARSDADRACLTAQLAAYQARMGNYSGAAEYIRELRTESNLSSPTIAAWIMFAEGLTLLRDELSRDGFDRMFRGFAIADSAGAADIGAQLASWLVQISYNQNRYSEMPRWIAHCNSKIIGKQHETRARLCLTFADAHRHAGYFEESNAWYQRVRLHAAAIGDEAFLSSLMYNRSANGISRLRYEEVSGIKNSVAANQLMLEIDSALSYSTVTGNKSAHHLQSMWKGRLLMHLERHLEAKSLLSVASEQMPEAKHAQLRTSLQADLMLCEAVAGKRSHAVELLQKLNETDLSDLAGDDQSVVIGQIAAANVLLNYQLASRDLDNALQAARLEHEREIQLLRVILRCCDEYVDMQ